MMSAKFGKKRGGQPRSRRWRGIVGAIVVGVAVFASMGAWLVWLNGNDSKRNSQGVKQVERTDFTGGNPDNPLSNRKFYTDNSRAVNKQLAEYQRTGDTANAELLQRIASQPGTIWLTGPTAADPTAARDIATVQRTSKEAAAAGTLPIYQLYAIPKRDACAGYSGGGWRTGTDYLAWVDRVISALKTEAVITVETDSIAHTLNTNCMSAQEVSARYALLKNAAMKLSASDRVLAIYLDGGHSDWFADPVKLVQPLQQSGIEYARGVTVNVSFFAETTAITAWSEQLVQLLGGNKGVMIDTSRNGKGIASLTGDARWCNPPGRGLGPRPTTIVKAKHVDAYFWGKNPGESDGNCFGNPAAGVFVPAIALELSRNAIEQ